MRTEPLVYPEVLWDQDGRPLSIRADMVFGPRQALRAHLMTVEATSVWETMAEYGVTWIDYRGKLLLSRDHYRDLVESIRLRHWAHRPIDNGPDEYPWKMVHDDEPDAVAYWVIPE